MKKFVILAVLIALFSVSIASADSSPCYPVASMVNQNPSPATPGSYVDVLFQVTNIDGAECNRGVWFEFIPKYPFSLEGNDGVRELNGNTFTADYNNDWMIPFKLRVDKDALEGSYSIEVHYDNDPSNRDSGVYRTKVFNITVENSATTFDAVVQESTDAQVTIAIANTGKNAANSVVVRVPEQDGFRITGTDGQMVGNLDSGDYTVVSFSVARKGAMQDITTANGGRNFPARTANNDPLKFDIYYTDNLGERRIVNMELPLNIASPQISADGLPISTNAVKRGNVTSTSSLLPSWLQMILAALVGALITFVAVKKFSGSGKHSKLTSKLPDWMDKSKEK